MNKSKKKPPSRIKYEESHPVVSFRLPKEDYDNLVRIKAQTDYSLAYIVKEAIDKQAIDVEMAYWTGYEDAERILRVNYRCSVCGKVITVKTDEEKKAIVQYMSEHGWGHAKCLKRES